MLIRRYNLWDLPKGGQEEGETLHETALREVQEELGTDKPLLGPFLAETQHDYVYDGTHFHKHVFWYAMEPTSTRYHPQEEESISELKWTPLHEAIEKVAFDNLRIPLQQLAVHLAG
jgi:8-oxo-dGTP pyrophosphatase MutT (NUDIX family)